MSTGRSPFAQKIGIGSVQIARTFGTLVLFSAIVVILRLSTVAYYLFAAAALVLFPSRNILYPLLIVAGIFTLNLCNMVFFARDINYAIGS